MRLVPEPAPGALSPLSVCRLGRAQFLLSTFTACLVLSGCAGYKLGPTNNLAAGEKSVQITPFANQTLEPRLGDAVTGALKLY